MPELPEVETLRRGLLPPLCGQRLRRVEFFRRDLRYPVPEGMEERLEGAVLSDIRRRAKYLLFDWGKHGGMLVHLGMSGTLTLAPPEASPALRKHDHARFTFADGTRMLYHDPRRFGMILPLAQGEEKTHGLLSSLGLEPLCDGFTAADLREKLQACRAPVKHALMDQTRVVGVGNIYACEALFKARLHPFLPACDAAVFSDRIVHAVRHVLEAAIASGGSTLRDYLHADGASGYFQHFFHVYGRDRKSCTSCNQEIVRVTSAGRATFFCPRCQVMP